MLIGNKIVTPNIFLALTFDSMETVNLNIPFRKVSHCKFERYIPWSDYIIQKK